MARIEEEVSRLIKENILRGDIEEAISFTRQFQATSEGLAEICKYYEGENQLHLAKYYAKEFGLPEMVEKYDKLLKKNPNCAGPRVVRNWGGHDVIFMYGCPM